MTGYIDYQYIDTIHFFLGQILLFYLSKYIFNQITNIVTVEYQ